MPTSLAGVNTLVPNRLVFHAIQTGHIPPLAGYDTGQWRHAHTPIRIKKHGRKAVSLFRYGLDCLREVLLNLSERSNEFRKIIQILLRTFTISNDTSKLEPI